MLKGLVIKNNYGNCSKNRYRMWDFQTCRRKKGVKSKNIKISIKKIKMEGKEERKKWDIHKIHNKMVGKNANI